MLTRNSPSGLSRVLVTTGALRTMALPLGAVPRLLQLIQIRIVNLLALASDRRPGCGIATRRRRKGGKISSKPGRVTASIRKVEVVDGIANDTNTYRS
ncbi:MAG: hypothetical protein K2W95_04845 [Candidatus Obscuribacterales bacterium]|nr:hypothetical protein [Candidatus Obscuribacterales bacterium]